jgi:hypothetical protein
MTGALGLTLAKKKSGVSVPSWEGDLNRQQIGSLALAALVYSQEYGWPVFPCGRGRKEPLISKQDGGSGCHDASTFAEQVSSWWDTWPNANIAVATGGAIGLLVVDVDGEEGETALERLGELPETPTARTAKGRHLYFHTSRQAARCTARRLGPKLDTRGDGGYVVAPPSVHPSGDVYAWVRGRAPSDVPLARLPHHIADRIAMPLSVQADVDSARQGVPHPVAPLIPHGVDLTKLKAWMARVPTGLRLGDGRNDIAYRIAARALEVLSVMDTEALLTAWNRSNAEPLTAAALSRVLANALRYARRRAA